MARDVMVQCHWNNFNTFEHYGSGGLDMMGWDPLKNGLLPLFGFGEYDAELLHQQLLDSIPRNVAGNPDSPQAVIFLTSFIDAMWVF